jgi:TATA-box binding protein (TBP) (component of TFIID and TFIIIB)
MKLIDTNLINMEKLPDKVKIATISATCSLNVDINIFDIWKFFPLNDEIRTIKFNKDIKSTDSKLLEKEKKKREKKLKKQNSIKNKKKKTKRKSGDNFYNCIIIVVNVSPTKIINIKLFRNGSIQMTGSKNLHQTEKALQIITKYLKIKYYRKDNKKRILVPLLVRKLNEEEQANLKQFCDALNSKKLSDEKKLELARNFRFSPSMKMDFRKLKLSNFNVNMINTSFALDYKIQLPSLNLLLEKTPECIVTYEPSIHAGINIKINRDDTTECEKKATILVFQSNDPNKMCNLIITGVTQVDHILKAYHFIIKILTDNKKNIIKINVEDLMKIEQKRLEEEQKRFEEWEEQEYSMLSDDDSSSSLSENIFIRTHGIVDIN